MAVAGTGDVWRQLDGVLTAKYKTVDGRLLTVIAACVDAGGHHAAAVHSYCETRRARRVYAIRGQGGAGKPIWPKAAGQSRRYHGATVWSVGVDSAKEAIFARLRVDPGRPGYMHLPDDLDSGYEERWASQLLSERIETTRVRGQLVRRWVLPHGARNEALDCRAYALAALRSMNPNWPALLAQTVRTATPRPPPAKRQGRSWPGGSVCELVKYYFFRTYPSARRIKCLALLLTY